MAILESSGSQPFIAIDLDLLARTLPRWKPTNSAPALVGSGLGDLLAGLLRRLGIAAAVALLQRRGWLPADCGCAVRQARLNALTPRLLALLAPWPLTSLTLLAWLLFALLIWAR